VFSFIITFRNKTHKEKNTFDGNLDVLG